MIRAALGLVSRPGRLLKVGAGIAVAAAVGWLWIDLQLTESALATKEAEVARLEQDLRQARENAAELEAAVEHQAERIAALQQRARESSARADERAAAALERGRERSRSVQGSGPEVMNAWQAELFSQP